MNAPKLKQALPSIGIVAALVLSIGSACAAGYLLWASKHPVDQEPKISSTNNEGYLTQIVNGLNNRVNKLEQNPAPQNVPNQPASFDSFEYGQLKAVAQEEYFKNLSSISGNVVTLNQPAEAFWQLTVPKDIWDEYSQKSVSFESNSNLPTIRLYAPANFRSGKSIEMAFEYPGVGESFVDCPTSTYSDEWRRAAVVVKEEIRPSSTDLDVCKSLKKVAVGLHEAGTDHPKGGQVFRFEHANKETGMYEVWFIDGTNYSPEVLKISGLERADTDYGEPSKSDVLSVADSIEHGALMCVVSDYAGCY